MHWTDEAPAQNTGRTFPPPVRRSTKKMRWRSVAKTIGPRSHFENWLADTPSPRAKRSPPAKFGRRPGPEALARERQRTTVEAPTSPGRSKPAEIGPEAFLSAWAQSESSRAPHRGQATDTAPLRRRRSVFIPPTTATVLPTRSLNSATGLCSDCVPRTGAGFLPGSQNSRALFRTPQLPLPHAQSLLRFRANDLAFVSA